MVGEGEGEEEDQVFVTKTRRAAAKAEEADCEKSFLEGKRELSKGSA